jgi:hypothetical protein
MHEHDYKVRSLSAPGAGEEHEIACECGFRFVATSEKYAEAVGKRHVQLKEE